MVLDEFIRDARNEAHDAMTIVSLGALRDLAAGIARGDQSCPRACGPGKAETCLALVLRRRYSGILKTTLTFRMEKEQREKLRKRAAALGKSESELLREILDRELDEPPLSERIGHLAGSISLPKEKQDDWGKHIRKQNWRS